MAKQPLSQKRLSIGVDLMGSDNAPEQLISAIGEMAPATRVDFVLIGTPDLEKFIAPPLLFCAAPDVIEMDENPLSALRQKKRASMCVGLRLLKAKKIDALVSSGNTGALAAAAKIILGTFPGILRPALLAAMPTKKRPVAVLDVGANVAILEKHLIQFALMGAAYCRAKYGAQKPLVGLLNIGAEPLKGTSMLRGAYRRLQNLESPPFHFSGNVEGKTVFDGDVDVLITDGFTGNIFLKTAEGIASLILDRLQALGTSAEIQSKFDDLQTHLHYAKYPGALLIGVQGLVIKCHGYSTPEAIAGGIRGAIELAELQLIKNVRLLMMPL